MSSGRSAREGGEGHEALVGRDLHAGQGAVAERARLGKGDGLRDVAVEFSQDAGHVARVAFDQGRQRVGHARPFRDLRAERAGLGIYVLGGAGGLLDSGDEGVGRVRGGLGEWRCRRYTDE